ncbi:uncharacterized protein ACMZJ9_010465 [Mantella aurantiaca]
MDSYDMKEYIQNFSLDNCRLGNQGYSRVLIQLFGSMGHGKSSFINSCKYVIDDGSYKNVADVSNSMATATIKRNSYQLTENIVLVDNRGFNKMTRDETGQIYAQLGNFQPLDTEVTWQREGFDSTIKSLLMSESEDRSTDFIVPVLVHSARASISSDQKKELNEVLDTATKITGLFPSVVITNELHQNLRDVQEKFRQMGVKNMFPLENYTETDHLKTRGKHETMVKCLYEIIKDVAFRMGEKRDPIGEKIQRKEILLNFIHEREKDKAVQEALQCAKESERRAVQEAERRAREAAENNKTCIVQ